MCMSVKKIEERISTAKNEVLEQKLQKTAQSEKVDNYAICMVSDRYEYGVIYAISNLVLGFVKIKEGMCGLIKNEKPVDAYSA